MNKSIILITTDALRYDHLSCLDLISYNIDTTPFFDSLIENEATLFGQHTSTGSGTSTSFPGIHASSLPLTNGYAGLNQDHTSLAEVLQRNSVQTIGVTAQTSCSSLYDYDRGFDVFEDWVTEEGLDRETGSFSAKLKKYVKKFLKNNPLIVPIGLRFYQFLQRDTVDRCPYRRATEVTDTTLSLVDKHVDPNSPFFIWVHFMEPHSPHHPPERFVKKFYDGDWTEERINEVILRTNLMRSDIADGTMRELVSDEEIRAIRDFYAAATRYVDSEIKRLINEFKDRNLLEDAAIFVTADHGEELFDHGDLGHRPKMYDELIRVPLIYFDESEELNQHQQIQQVTSHIDIAPTITDLLQLDTPEIWEGQSLIKYIKNEDMPSRDYAIAELCHRSGLGGSVNLDKYIGAVRKKDWKYIQNRQLNKNELYDLVNDTEEQQNIIKSTSQQTQELSEILEKRLDGLTERTLDTDISDKAQNRLRELGYLDE